MENNLHIPKIMAILNITPDSFSDGNDYFNIENAISIIQDMIEAKVDVIDIGAESTSPGATAISVDQEIKRLEEIIPRAKDLIIGQQTLLSLDSRNYQTLHKFIHHIDMINDVTAGADQKILDLVRDYKKLYCFYFSTSIPVDRNKFLPNNTDLIKYFSNWVEEKITTFLSSDIKKEQLIFDPGIGFGLNPTQSLEMIKNIDKINTCGIKVLIGHSRKSFLAQFGEKDARKRDPETHVLTSYLARKKVDYIRVHNFIETKRVLELTKKLYN